MPKDKQGMGKYNAWPNALRFLASLFFLYVIFGGATASTAWWSPWVVNGAGSLWLPILFGAAVLSTIALFFGTLFFGGLSMAGMAPKMNGSGMGWKTALIAAFSLTALTVSPSFSGVFWVVIVGFILAWVGTAMEWMM
jgi:hypothetical protein